METRYLMRQGLTRRDAFVAVAVSAAILCILMPAVRNSRECARRNQCADNLRRVGMALTGFDTAYGHLPPGAIMGEGSAWSLYSLPFLEMSVAQLPSFPQVGEGVSGNYGWAYPKPYEDSTNLDAVYQNVRLVEMVIEPYRCPEAALPEHQTDVSSDGWWVMRRSPASYLGVASGRVKSQLASREVVGAGLEQPEGRQITNADGVLFGVPNISLERSDKVSLRDVPDGSTQTALVGEALHDAAAVDRRIAEAAVGNRKDHWWGGSDDVDSEGRDPSEFLGSTGVGINLHREANQNSSPCSEPNSSACQELQLSFSSNHSDVVQMVFCDGRCEAISEDIDQTVWSSYGCRYDVDSSAVRPPLADIAANERKLPQADLPPDALSIAEDQMAARQFENAAEAFKQYLAGQSTIQHRIIGALGEQDEARLGLAMCLLRLKQADDAIALLTELHQTKLSMISTGESELVLQLWKELSNREPDPQGDSGFDGLRFSGTGYVMIPELYFDGHAPWTLEAIINPLAVAVGDDWTSLISATDGGSIGLESNGGRWSIALYTKQGFSERWQDNYSVAFANEAVDTGKWQHLAGVWDGKQLRMYVDGRLHEVCEGIEYCTKLSEGPFFVGADPDDLSREGIAQGHFNGIIKEVRISRAAEYSDSFESPQTLNKTEGTICLYDFTSESGEFAIDRSGHGNHGIIYNASYERSE